MEETHKITAKIFDFFITQRCTMNCKLCAAAVPYIKNPRHTPPEIAFREMEKFFAVWDYAERIEFIGGEPLSHPAIYDIVKESLKYQAQFGKMRITTNATLIPSDKLCDLAANCGTEFDFIVDDYGPYSRNLTPLLRQLEKFNLPYRVDVYHGDEQRYGGWIYFGDYTLVNNGINAAEAFENCICPKNQFVCVNAGKAFSCVYTMCLYWLHGMFPNDGSCLDLFSDGISIEHKRHVANHFCESPIEACKYCYGFNAKYGQRYPGPPEQISKKGAFNYE